MSARLKLALLAVVALSISLITTPTLWAQDVPYEREMWPTENRFVAAFIAGDVDALESMWHDDLNYWPAGEDRPWGKRYARKTLNQWSGAADGTLSKPMLEPMAAKVMGNFAMTHYRLEYTITDGDGGETRRQLRLSHTWSKADDGWQLIGGSNTELED